MSDELKYTYMQDEHGSYIIIRDNEDIGLSPQDLCTHLNALEAKLSKMEEALKEIGFAFPTILEGDNPMEVARWFTLRAREALAGAFEVKAAAGRRR